MATGDAAATAGMDVVDGVTTAANTIDTEINKTRDYLALGYGATTPATANKVVKRDSNGRAKIATPSANDDIANKGYVDAQAPGAGSITNSMLATDSVTASKIAANAVGSSEIAANAVTTAKIANLSVTGAKIVDGAIDVNQIAPAVLADISKGADGNHNHSASQITSGTLSRPVSTSGSGRFGAAWDNNITSTRRAVWMEDDGTLGHTASARKFKQNIEPAELTEAQLRAIPIVLYRYRAAVARERNGGPRAAVEIGTLADDLHTLGLWQFLVYEGHGDEAEPISVHYEILALAALALAQQLADRLDTLDERVAVLERNHE